VVKSLSTEEKREIQTLLQQHLCEKIYFNFKVAQVEQDRDELKLSANIQELKLLIEE
jgi:hypothetical protein